MEYERALKITIKIYRDTNKATYNDEETFDNFSDAVEWLQEKRRD